jgi:predicted N-acetyltransferase YhbS
MGETSASCEIRPATRADGPALRALSVATFPNDAEADLVDALVAGDAWIDGLSHVAEAEDGSLVAYAILSRCEIDGWPALALAPCAVRPDLQRQGVGTATIAAALDAARAAGEALVVVLGHAAYYPRFGFVRASTLGIGAPLDVPDDAWMALLLDPERASPSGTVVYADAFGVGT